MRQIGTLPDASQAQLLADYLLTLRIQTHLDQQPAGWEVWVRDEDQVDQARQILAEFRQTPTDPRYSAAQRAARALRQEEERQEEEYRRKQINLQRKMTQEATPTRWASSLLVLVSVLITLLTNFGESQPLLRWFTITDLAHNGQAAPSLAHTLAEGQVWRLITPIFIHFGVFHLVFNMLWFAGLGGAIEQKRGSLRFLGLVLLLAIPSNLAQLYLGHATVAEGLHLLLIPSPRFGGMSGVVYGLFGYSWMKSRFEPELGLAVGSQTVAILMIWFFLCLTPAVEGVANMAHAAGLVLGFLAGLVPTSGHRSNRVR